VMTGIWTSQPGTATKLWLAMGAGMAVLPF